MGCFLAAYQLSHVCCAGVTIQAPQLDINTVAAGGGSRLFFRTGVFQVSRNTQYQGGQSQCLLKTLSVTPLSTCRDAVEFVSACCSTGACQIQSRMIIREALTHYRSHVFPACMQVGPESAGAHPGPVCYRKGGYAAITDANLVLGRILPEFFPNIFGPNGMHKLTADSSDVSEAGPAHCSCNNKTCCPVNVSKCCRLCIP